MSGHLNSGKKKTRLIGVGVVPAVPAKELQAGDRFMRNHGYTYKVLNIIPGQSGKYVTLVIEGETRRETGRIYKKKFLNETLVAKLDPPKPPG
ncbi:MAG: hypothetical protein K6U80_06755 [Firmicutes bacterium]|nr:hypothetical protein [Bacillota bacterium]